MSLAAMTWAWEQACRCPGEKLALLALADHCSDEGYCYPGLALVAAKTGMSERNVRRHVRALEQRGLVQREDRFRDDRTQTSNGYRLLFPEKYTRTRTSSPPDASVPLPRTCTSAPPGRQRPPYEPSVEPSVEPIPPPLPTGEAPQGGPRTAGRDSSPVFVPPTLEEARAYAVELGMDADEGDAFVDRYEAGGWMVWRSPMKDWHSAMRTWRRNREKFGPSGRKEEKPDYVMRGGPKRPKWSEEEKPDYVMRGGPKREW